VDETLDQSLDKKPEEKLWIVVATHRSPDFNFPTIRLKKFDLFKVGRVRFKVREIVSPYYREENRLNEELSEKYRAQYPVKEPSIQQSVLESDEDEPHMEQTFRSPTLEGAVMMSQGADDLGYNPHLIAGFTSD
jgi:hypothetical protein